MKRIFTISGGFTVLDGTTVYPFLNAKDSTSGLQRDLLDDFSLAAGDIAPYRTLRTHVTLWIIEVAAVLRGQLEVVMQDAQDTRPYRQRLAEHQAVITRPGTLFQLVNATDVPCPVLYIVSPPCVFDQRDHQILYDDVIVLDEDWTVLAGQNWQPPAMLPSRDAREAALNRLAQRA
jgi:hypothetical protein